ncbi:MAG: VCBS repeat-containing protein [Bacteroidia bacterium]|nr:VCBS repeat-containing protein [Bacteroidia bacterium]
MNGRLSPLLLVSGLIIAAGLQAQPQFRKSDSIPVFYFQNTLSHPWAGGINAAQFSSIDLNQDGAQDLMVFDREGNRLTTFVHDGTPGSFGYRYAPEYEAAFPACSSYALLRDFDGDGHPDLFTYAGNQELLVLRNARADSGKLAFVPYPGGHPLKSLRSSNMLQAIKIVAQDIPALEDLDNDGDLDLLTFNLLGTMIEYHENRSQDLYGHRDSLVFVLETGCWGAVMEEGTTNAMSLGISCKTDGLDEPGAGAEAHVGSTLLAFDLNNDGDKEVLIGDIGYSAMLLLNNGGTPDNAFIVSQNNLFPLSYPIDLDIFPAAYYLDVNHDQKRDLIVTPNTTVSSENLASVWCYENTQSGAPQFQYFTNDFLQSEMLDVGSGAFPLLVDYTLDGKADLLIGSHGSFYTESYFPTLYLLRNVGSDTAAAFSMITDNFASVQLEDYPAGLHAAMGDLDQDGDLDLIVGKGNGTLDCYKNISIQPDATLPTMVLETSDLGGIDIGAAAAPALEDIDGDGLPDLIIGNRTGVLHYFRNTGTAAAPAFTQISDSFAQVNTAPQPIVPGFSVPALYREGDSLTLLVGSDAGFILRLTRPDPAQPEHFVLRDTIRLGTGRRSAPAMADLNGDGTPDLLVGNFAGGISLFFGIPQAGDTSSTSVEPPALLAGVRVYPNPASGTVWMEAPAHAGPVRCEVFTADGRAVEAFILAPAAAQIAAAGWPQGLLMLRFSAPGHAPVWKKLMIR